jgi:hypothetical protein
MTVADFEPRTKDERSRLAALHERLSFDPTREPHVMSSTGHPLERDTKTVHDRLLAGSDSGRWKDCLAVLLRAKDTRTLYRGASQFLTDVREALLPRVREWLTEGRSQC